ncbi:MAG: hypothetical protein U0K57_00930 [Lachnospiraceae bacterium]|nr:hypothetical protein [Lachnospiraceae bacterium]
MKKALLSLTVLAGLMIALPNCNVKAFQHGYPRRTEEIYAIARQELPVYEDSDGYNLKKTLKKYTGFDVTYQGSSWYEIEYYTKKDGTQTGWITEGSFRENCLIYDGSEKQVMANGTYTVSQVQAKMDDLMDPSLESTAEAMTDSLSQYSFQLEYVSGGSYRIKRTDTNRYLLADRIFSGQDTNLLWGDAEDAGLFQISRTGDDYTIQDSVTNRYFGTTKDGLPGFVADSSYTWRFVRDGKAIDKSVLRDFTQFDPDWGGKYYGPGKNDNPESNLYCTSACGVLASVNAVYALNGQYIDPLEIGRFAVKRGYRILDNGTSNEVFENAAYQFGDKYGFTFDGTGESLDELKRRLKKGEVAIAHVEGHYLAIVDYNKKNNKFLLLDSHYLPKRRTCSYGDWVKQENLEDGSALNVSELFYFKALSH